MEKQKKILIAPLDWGWGHATRCLPIIDYLISKNVNVVVAGKENYKKFIEEKHPTLPYIFLKGYNVQYAKSANWLGIKIALQVPKIISRLIQEYFWLKKLQDIEQFDAIISDNRYGLFSKNVTTVFMTHQVEIETPLLKKLVNVINRFFIKKHNYLWIPDDKEFNFAGKLSKSKNDLIPTFYLGNLSQLSILNKEVEKTIDMLCILSGPEPQRSILEEMICSIFQKDQSKKCVLIQGKKTNNLSSNTNDNIELIPFANSIEIENYFQKSKIIICRSGYSTIMDLIKLGKNAILIPTPGQSEQEYLGKFLDEKKYFLKATQQKEEIENAILKFEKVKFKSFPKQNMEQYKIGIDELLEKI